MLSDFFRPCEDLFSKVPFKCCLGVCWRENQTVTIKQGVFQETKQNQGVIRTLTSLLLLLISPGEKTLNTCATQALRELMEKIEIVVSTDSPRVR